MIGNWLLCDFHIHTSLSDGRVALSEVVDSFGIHGFDVISITDHVMDSPTEKTLLERGGRYPGVQRIHFSTYLQKLWNEARRAWEKYHMLVIPGTELTNENYHILAIDIKEYVDPTLPVEKIIEAVHHQEGIAVACHPHHKESDRTHTSLYLWERYKQYAPLFDAWEVANRDDLFNVIGLKKFNYIANSDYHEPWHLYSWKTLIHAEKNTEAVKQAIRKNQNVSIHLFRKGSYSSQ